MKNIVHYLAVCACLFSVSCQVISDDVTYLKYDNLVVSESSANDGTFSATIDVEIVGDTFRETLTEEDDYLVSGLLNGLTATLTRVDDNNLTFTVSGTVANHIRCATETAGLNIYKTATASGNRPQNASVNLYVSLTGASYSLSGTSLSEDSPNSGTVSGTTTLTLSGGGTITVPSPLAQDTHFEV
ncbi:MAG: hypothetical protein KDK51_09430, partial [Deltaproteobacteria bacterium]|nr:hypothetical protein [Deltaproteobacteria bacterium]